MVRTRPSPSDKRENCIGIMIFYLVGLLYLLGHARFCDSALLRFNLLCFLLLFSFSLLITGHGLCLVRARILEIALGNGKLKFHTVGGLSVLCGRRLSTV